jgi:hypothetical protein
MSILLDVTGREESVACGEHPTFMNRVPFKFLKIRRTYTNSGPVVYASQKPLISRLGFSLSVSEESLNFK